MGLLRLRFEEEFPPSCRNGAISIGNFDGVHIGHCRLMATLRERAKAVGGPAIAVTFDPHPIQLLAPDRLLPRLTTPADRADLLQAAGAGHRISLVTTETLLQRSPSQFLDEVVKNRFGAKAMVEGHDFGFGRGREGNIEFLREWCPKNQVNLTVVSPVEEGGQTVSSSQVRKALEA